jgi:hypothetical protein
VTDVALAQKLLAIHRALDGGGIPHAFGGALALAYLTEEPRATKDIDVNVFVPVDAVDRVFAALPPEVHASPSDADRVRHDAQVRLWWGHTPVDLFFDVDEIHRDAALHTRVVPFSGTTIPVLDGNELAVFKMMNSRPKDWLDITEMIRAGTMEVEVVAAAFARIMGDDREAIDRLRALAAEHDR